MHLWRHISDNHNVVIINVMIPMEGVTKNVININSVNIRKFRNMLINNLPIKNLTNIIFIQTIEKKKINNRR